MSTSRKGIDPSAAPTGTGCVECLESGAWWLHLRRCAECGHVGCCDSSPHRHASKHAAETGHSVVASFEPGEGWFYDYGLDAEVEPADLPPPHARPLDQPTPGPRGKVPPNWPSLLH